MQETMLKILDEAEVHGLPFLLVGGHAVILSGFARNTIDIDLLVPECTRSRWSEVLTKMGFRCFHMTHAFAQFTGGSQLTPVDLMFVNADTWEKLSTNPRTTDLGGRPVRLPHPEHLVAMKLHAASSPTRSKPEADWEDIRHLVLLNHLDISSPSFRDLVIRYGGESAVLRIESFQQ